jgi:hypothetical protein
VAPRLILSTRSPALRLTLRSYDRRRGNHTGNRVSVLKFLMGLSKGKVTRSQSFKMLAGDSLRVLGFLFDPADPRRKGRAGEQSSTAEHKEHKSTGSTKCEANL